MIRSLVRVAALLCVCVIGVAHAERRLFIIANNPDEYGVDRCLASGDKCGSAVASAYCKSHAFAAAKSYRKVDRGDITGAIPVSGSAACAGEQCGSFVAIVCTR